MRNENALVTFIVPAYNAEKYIGECLDSLLYQTVKDHKVIVVNDGSKDSTGLIARKYADRYPEMFHYCEQENQGQGTARNVALKLVETQYVTFLDCDDWQDCHFVERLVDEIKNHDEAADIIFTLPWVYNAVTHEKSDWRDKMVFEYLFYPEGGRENVPSRVVTPNDPTWFSLYKLEVSPCRRVFRSQFLKDIHYQFVEGMKWEDALPHFQSLHFAKRCIGLRSSGFVYRTNNSTQTTSGGGVSRMDIAPVFSQILETATQENWSTKEIAYIIRTFRSFTDWTIQVTNMDYIVPVLKSLHAAYRDIPKRCLKAYRNTFHMGGKDTIMIQLLRSPFYGLLKDYRTRNAGMRFVAKLKRLKAMIRR